MEYYLNLVACLLTIAFGLFGFLAPRFTASTLDLAPTRSNMGLSELRASVGGLFVVSGVAAIFINNPISYIMLGVAYSGAALGRLVSLAIDKPPVKKTSLFASIEAVLALWLILGNVA
ncbi:MAG: DUF4345 family protein [Paracoccaceae bacterium]